MSANSKTYIILKRREYKRLIPSVCDKEQVHNFAIRSSRYLHFLNVNLKLVKNLCDIYQYRTTTTTNSLISNLESTRINQEHKTDREANHIKALCDQSKLASARKDQEAETQSQKGNISRYQRPKQKQDSPPQASSSTDSISCSVPQSPRTPSNTIFRRWIHLHTEEFHRTR